jgi:hypothetical protein
MRMMTPVKIKTVTKGIVIVDGIIYGPCAVTRESPKHDWRVTHIPSGLAMGPTMTKRKAIQVAKYVERHSGFFTGIAKGKPGKREKAAGKVFEAILILLDVEW